MMKLLLWSAGAVLVFVIILSLPAGAQEAAKEGASATQSLGRIMGLAVAAALAVGLSVLGAGYAVGKIGAAALGAAVEKP